MEKFNLDKWGEESTAENTSDFFKIPTGKTKLRVLTDFIKVQTVWEGVYPDSRPVGAYKGEQLKADQTIQTRGWAWVEVNGELKIVQFPVSIIGKLAELKDNDEYSWDGMPMPFDITISNSGEGPNRYSLEPARTNTPVSEAILKKLEEVTPIEDILEKIEEKRSKKDNVDLTPEYPESDGEPTI